MLDVQGRVDVDAGRQQFLDIQVAFGVTAARNVAVRQFIDQHQARAARQDRVQVHLGQGLPAIVDAAARDGFQPADQRLGFRPSVGFHHPDDDIDTLALPRLGRREHLVRFADARSCTEEDLQPAALRLRRLFQERVRRRPSAGMRIFAHLLSIQAASSSPAQKSASRARLSSTTFTCGSPISPTRRPVV